MDWQQVGIVLGIVMTVGTIVYVALKMRLQADFDYRYMTIRGCEDKHKVTDTVLASMRDDIREIKEALQKIHEIIYEAIRGISK